MKYYKTLRGEIFCINDLPKAHIKFYEEVDEYYIQNLNWNEFNRLWLSQINSLFVKVERGKIVQTSIFKICQDMESRLGGNVHTHLAVLSLSH